MPEKEAPGAGKHRAQALKWAAGRLRGEPPAGSGTWGIRRHAVDVVLRGHNVKGGLIT